MAVTVPMAEEIRRLRDGRVRPPEIASLVGVSVRTVHAVLAGQIVGRSLAPREQFEEDERTGWAPLCMEPDEWASWRASASFSGIHTEQAARPCADCPLGFAADMRAEGRCNGTPGGVQVDQEDAEVLAEEKEYPMDPTPNMPPGRRIDVEVAAPCGSCVHTGICRIEPTLVELRRLQASLPLLDDAVRVELSAQVGCTHYAKAKGAKPAAAPAKREPVGDDRRARILEVLASHGGDIAAAAAQLGERPNVIARIRNAAERQAVVS